MNKREIENWMYEELKTHREQYTWLNYEGEPRYDLQELVAAAQAQIAPDLEDAELELLARDMLSWAQEGGLL